ncbi:ComEC/Rec2 family competence protein [Hyphomonas sp.]|uniref:ComEC/Rec2 family competence protein n=1 Tax=Hyphomonas sp. TaxID=87 RepID=UPI00391CA9A7
MKTEAPALTGARLRPLLLAFAACAGAAIYLTLPFEPQPEATLLLAGAVAVSLLIVRQVRRSDGIYTLLVVLAGMSAGFVAGMLKAADAAAPAILSETRPLMIEGWVTAIEPGQNGARLKIQVHAIAGLAAEQTPRQVRVTHMSSLEVFPGRFVRCWSVLRPAPAPSLPGDYDFRRQAYFDQLGAVGYVQGRCRGGALGRPVGRLDQAALWIASKRRLIAEHVNRAGGERAGGLAAALITGDRSFLRFEDQEALRNTGLAHLLAISGLHLSIVGGLVYLIARRALAFIEPLALRFPVQKVAAFLALAACAGYLVLSGAGVSTQRAFIMASIVFAAIVFDRSAVSLRTFSIALLAMVLIWPESVVTPGFQMSFAATGALIAFYASWRSHRSAHPGRILGPVAFAWASIIMTSIVSDAATAPYALYHFDRVSPVGLFTNFTVMPIITFVTAPLAAVTLILLPFGFADDGLAWFGKSLELVLWLSHSFESLSPGPVRPTAAMPAMTLVLFSLAMACLILFRGWLRIVMVAGWIIAGAFSWQAAPRLVLHWSPSGAAFIAGEDGIVRRHTLTKGAGLSPLRYSWVEDAPPCPQEACTITALGKVQVRQALQAGGLAADKPQPVLEVRIDEDPPIILTWQEVAATGGTTLFLQGSHLRLRTPAACGARRWAPCAGSPAPPNRSGE